MRYTLLAILLIIPLFAKDNFIFDYRYDPMIVEKIDRLEREIAELKASNINLKQTQQELVNRYQTRPAQTDLRGVEREIAALKKAVQTRPQAKGTQVAAVGDQKLIYEKIDNLEQAVEQLKNRDSTLEFTKINRQLGLLNERLSTQENLAKRELTPLVEKESDAPFSDFVVLTKSQVEYLILGVMIFIALIFLLAALALAKAKKAEEKVSQIVKLYQSSSRKIEDRK